MVRLLSPVNAKGLREERALLERFLDEWIEQKDHHNTDKVHAMHDIGTHSEVRLDIGENTPSGRELIALPLKSLKSQKYYGLHVFGYRFCIKICMDT